MSWDTLSKPQTLRFHLACLTFAGTALHITPRVSANTSWTHIPKYTIKTSDPKISSHMFDFGRNSSPYYTAHFGKHILNQHHKVHHKTSNPKIPFYASLFWNLWEQLPTLHHAFLQTHPKKTSRDDQRYTIKTSDPKISSHMFGFCRHSSLYFKHYTAHSVAMSITPGVIIQSHSVLQSHLEKYASNKKQNALHKPPKHSSTFLA